MVKVLDLASLPWTLAGYRPDHWSAGASIELGMHLLPEIAPVPMPVPGSVQNALRCAGLLPDWNLGTNSRACEWVESREWVLETLLPDEWFASGSEAARVRLCAQGLDGLGEVYLNGRRVGAFANAFVGHRFDIAAGLRPAGNRLQLVFAHQPPWLGQIGYTSRMPLNKPRFNYGWDWTPRLVQIGVSGKIQIEASGGTVINSSRAYTTFDYRTCKGEVAAHVCCEEGCGARIEVAVLDRQRLMGQMQVPVTAADGQETEVRLPLEGLEPWWPSGLGESRLYDLTIRLLCREGTVVQTQHHQVGFRQIEWTACDGAPAGALPWVCVVNGRPLFLQGFNWVPIRPNFADVSDEMYERLLSLYRELGTNVLRVWGGAVLEREIFYKTCDRLGILVWQELPLSSSGIDNWPPESPEAIETIKGIAHDYAAQRQHHPSLLMWCGGNELQGSPTGAKQGVGRPVPADHPLLAEAGRLLATLDPTRRFVPSSASGPTFTAEANRFGQGVHHDVHGPWGHSGDLPSWQAYWDADDALFRSETGMPGASDAELIRFYAQHQACPPDGSNGYYLHLSSWWLQAEAFQAAGGDLSDLDAYVNWSQARQAQFLSVAATACKRRFPRCGGIIIWMGHDCFPVPINTSVIDYEGQCKPAALALKAVFCELPPDEAVSD